MPAPTPSDLHPDPAPRAPGDAVPLTRLERATGVVLIGQDPESRPLDDLLRNPSRAARPNPRAALAAAVVGPLRSGPCYVSFSGGRDSSAVLATCTEVARREGLPDPIPITLRFAGVPSTEESHYQEVVVDHLGLGRWDVIEIDEELDLLGPIARRALEAHGHLYPPNAYFHVPMLERASGGSLLTGFDGDGVFGYWRWERAQSALHGRRGRVPRDLARIGLALAPPILRRPLMKPYVLRGVTWLTPAGRRELVRFSRTQDAAEPRRWDRHLAAFARSRHLRVIAHSLDLLGRARGVEVVHPLLDHDFLAALARAGGAAGFGARNDVMRAVFGGLLPDELLTRVGKAEFGRALWRSQARAFAEQWNGEGVDTELVDPERLREQWRAE